MHNVSRKQQWTNERYRLETKWWNSAIAHVKYHRAVISCVEKRREIPYESDTNAQTHTSDVADDDGIRSWLGSIFIEKKWVAGGKDETGLVIAVKCETWTRNSKETSLKSQPGRDEDMYNFVKHNLGMRCEKRRIS